MDQYALGVIVLQSAPESAAARLAELTGAAPTLMQPIKPGDRRWVVGATFNTDMAWRDLMDETHAFGTRYGLGSLSNYDSEKKRFYHFSYDGDDDFADETSWSRDDGFDSYDDFLHHCRGSMYVGLVDLMTSIIPPE